MTPLRLSALALCPVFLSTVAPLRSALVDDTFDTGVGAWTASSITLSVNSSGVFGTGNALQGSTGGQSVNLLARAFTPQTLASVGDTLSVSFDYRWVNATTSITDRIPSFGFYNSQGTASDYSDDSGYNVQVTPSFVKLQREAGGDNLPLAGNDDIGISGASASYAYGAATPVHFTLTLTRVAGGLELQTTLTPAGDTSPAVTLTHTQTSPLTFTYDEFLLRSRGTNFYLDNVVVAFSSIPEPGAFAALAGLAALGFAALRRRGA